GPAMGRAPCTGAPAERGTTRSGALAAPAGPLRFAAVPDARHLGERRRIRHRGGHQAPPLLLSSPPVAATPRLHAGRRPCQAYRPLRLLPARGRRTPLAAAAHAARPGTIGSRSARHGEGLGRRLERGLNRIGVAGLRLL